ncbi:MAG: hypothetical protein MJE77_08920 [Proteobacteria bacterium]|nr:hypothetical protein [Pseudomonadota bacterium]
MSNRVSTWALPARPSSTRASRLRDHFLALFDGPTRGPKILRAVPAEMSPPEMAPQEMAPQEMASRADFDDLTDKLKAATQTIKSRNNALAEADEKIANLTRQRDHLTWQCDHLTRQHDHLTRQHDHLARQRDELTRQRDHLTRQHDHLTRQRDELTRQHDDLTRQCDDLTRQHDHLTRQRDDLTQQRDDLKQHLERCKDTSEEWQLVAIKALGLDRRPDCEPAELRAALLDDEPLLVAAYRAMLASFAAQVGFLRDLLGQFMNNQPDDIRIAEQMADLNQLFSSLDQLARRQRGESLMNRVNKWSGSGQICDVDLNRFWTTFKNDDWTHWVPLLRADQVTTAYVQPLLPTSVYTRVLARTLRGMAQGLRGFMALADAAPDELQILAAAPDGIEQNTTSTERWLSPAQALSDQLRQQLSQLVRDARADCAGNLVTDIRAWGWSLRGQQCRHSEVQVYREQSFSQSLIAGDSARREYDHE